MNKTLVQDQFGRNAAQYLTSKSHAQGKSLERLVALTSPRIDWRVLDVATGGGHVAYTFAPHVARVWATDITQEMLDQVKAEAANRGLGNVRVAYAKAETLPFEDASFDLVTCRIAPHHFDSIPEFLAEAYRVLKSGATAAIVDNVVPAGTVGDYINAFERLRDPSHQRAWTMAEWRAAFVAAKLTITHEEELDKTIEVKTWAARYDAVTKSLLLSMLKLAAPDVNAALDPRGDGESATFRLREGLFVARKT